jgi:hypothetical protein
VDYLGDVPWDEDEMAKDWYARVKSRPSFRALLAGQALAQIRHGIGTGDAERLEAETARARLDGLAQGAAREDDLGPRRAASSCSA